MGWCTEFAHRIEHDCDEPMVAGSSSCSCSACGVVCTGKFPACAQVWQHGQEPVLLRLSGPLSPASQAVAEPSRPAPPAATNGASDLRASPAPPPRVDLNHATTAGNGNGAAAQDLLAEMRAICQRLEQTSSTRGARDAEAEARQERLVAQLQLLPDQIARGLSAAMREQHQLIMRDVRIALGDLVRELRSPQSPTRPD